MNNQDHGIVKNLCEKIKKNIIKKYGSVEDCCTEATQALFVALSDEDRVNELGLSVMPHIERMVGTFGETEHEWLRVDGEDFDPTNDQVDEPLIKVEKADIWCKLERGIEEFLS